MFVLSFLICIAWWACIILAGAWFGIWGVILALLASVILTKILFAIWLYAPGKRRRYNRGSARDGRRIDV